MDEGISQSSFLFPPPLPRFLFAFHTARLKSDTIRHMHMAQTTFIVFSPVRQERSMKCGSLLRIVVCEIWPDDRERVFCVAHTRRFTSQLLFSSKWIKQLKSNSDFLCRSHNRAKEKRATCDGEKYLSTTRYETKRLIIAKRFYFWGKQVKGISFRLCFSENAALQITSHSLGRVVLTSGVDKRLKPVPISKFIGASGPLIGNFKMPGGGRWISQKSGSCRRMRLLSPCMWQSHRAFSEKLATRWKGKHRFLS